MVTNFFTCSIYLHRTAARRLSVLHGFPAVTPLRGPPALSLDQISVSIHLIRMQY